MLPVIRVCWLRADGLFVDLRFVCVLKNGCYLHVSFDVGVVFVFCGCGCWVVGYDVVWSLLICRLSGVLLFSLVHAKIAWFWVGCDACVFGWFGLHWFGGVWW